MSVAQSTTLSTTQDVCGSPYRFPYRFTRSRHNCGDIEVSAEGVCRGEATMVRSGSLRFDHGPRIIQAANAAYLLVDAIRTVAAALADGGDVAAAIASAEEATRSVPVRESFPA